MRPLLQNLLTTDNAIRNQAETQLSQLIASNYKDALAAMLELTSLPNEEESLLASVLVKSKFLDGPATPVLSIEEQEALITRIRANFQPERKLAYLKKNAETIVAIYTKYVIRALKQSHILEILGIIQSIISSEHRNSQLLAMYMIEISCEYAFCDEFMVAQGRALEKMLAHGLSHPQLEVQAAAFQSLTVMVKSIINKKSLAQFEQALPAMTSKLIEFVQKDQLTAQTAFANFITMLEKHPTYVKHHLAGVLVLFTELVGNSSNTIGSALRITGMEGLRVLAHNFGTELKKSDYFGTITLPMYVKLIAECHHSSLEEWASDLTNTHLQKSDVSEAAIDNLMSFIPDLSVDFLLPKFISLIKQSIDSDRADLQHAGLSLMAILTEGAAVNFKPDLANIFRMVYRLAGTPHPRVLYDVIFVLAELSSEFAPDFQQHYGRDMLQLTITSLSHPIEKVRLCALQSIANFCTDIKDQPNALAPLVECLNQIAQLVSSVFEASVRDNRFELIQQCILCLGSLSDQCEQYFGQYYDHFMPGLRKYFDALDQHNFQGHSIRTKLVESMGYLLLSIKKTRPDVLLKDSREIMMGLLRVLDSIEADDNFRVGFFGFVEILVANLREKFQFLQQIFPHVNRGVNIQIECKLVDANAPVAQGQAVSELADSPLDIRMFGAKKRFLLNYSALEVKIEASVLFAQLGQSLGLLMDPYLPQCIETICQNINYENCWPVRLHMFQSIRYMIEDCSNDKQKMFFAKVVWDHIARRIQQAIKKKSAEELIESMETISCICKYFNKDIIGQLPLMLTSVLQTVNKIVDLHDQEEDGDSDGSDEVEPADSYEHVERTIGTLVKLGHQEFSGLMKYFPKDYESVEMS